MYQLVAPYDLIGKVRERWEQRIFGYTLPRAEFDALLSGEVFPGEILAHRMCSFWWDDFTYLDRSSEMTRERLASHEEEFLAAQSIVMSNLNPGNGCAVA